MAELEIRSEMTAWSVPPEARAEALATRPLLVVMHGFAANERDLAPMGPLLPERFVIASIRGPLSLTQGGYAWQPMGGQAHPDPELFEKPAAAITAWLDGVAAEYGASGTSVSLLGFSQGGAMVTHLMRMHPARFASGVFLSSFLGMYPLSTDAELAARKPPLFWGRDENDPIIGEESIEWAQRFLPEHFTLTAKTYPGMSHGISREELLDISRFLDDNVAD